MAEITEWVKNYSMVFLLLTIISSLAAKKAYKQYIQFFIEMLLVVMLVTPFFQAAGMSEDFFDRISYDHFWQGLDSIKQDQEKLAFLDDTYYIRYYEEMIQADIALMAEDAGYAVSDVQVKMNAAYEVESISLEVARQEGKQIIVGKIDSQPESAEITALKKKLAEYYQLKEENIRVAE